MLLLLVRHAYSQKNIGNRFDDPKDDDALTTQAVEEIKLLKKFLTPYVTRAKVARIYCSTRTRCKETAAYLASWFGVEWHSEPSLDPIFPGDLAGMKEARARELYPDLMHIRDQFREGQISGYAIQYPNGESVINFENRIRHWLMQLRQQLENEAIAIVISHRSFMMAAVNIAEKLHAGAHDNAYYRYVETSIEYAYEIRWNVENKPVVRMIRLRPILSENCSSPYGVA
jgi:broad specificity phosphatase PhoE